MSSALRLIPCQLNSIHASNAPDSGVQFSRARRCVEVRLVPELVTAKMSLVAERLIRLTDETPKGKPIEKWITPLHCRELPSPEGDDGSNETDSVSCTCESTALN